MVSQEANARKTERWPPQCPRSHITELQEVTARCPLQPDPFWDTVGPASSSCLYPRSGHQTVWRKDWDREGESP